MPWLRALLHGQKVYARAHPDGSLATEAGRVEVCYKASASRIYRARASNVIVEDTSPLPDDVCTPVAEPAGGGARPAASGRAGISSLTGAKSKSKSGSAGASSRRASSPSSSPSSRPPPPVEAPPGVVIAYADGACSGNPGPAGLGVVMLDDTQQVEVSEHIGVGTNNIAELSAIGRALDLVPDPHRALVIYTDSGYAIGVLSKGWKAKANTALVAQLRARLAERSAVRFVHVRGHAGVPLNERADELAREAVRTGRTRTERIARAAPP
jgi:ribonuclease HI